MKSSTVELPLNSVLRFTALKAGSEFPTQLRDKKMKQAGDETRSRSYNSPMVQFDTIQTQSCAQLQMTADVYMYIPSPYKSLELPAVNAPLEMKA